MTKGIHTHTNTHTYLYTEAYVICKTSPLQPKDKGAVVARQQVSLAPTHLEAASVFLRSLSDCLSRPEVIHPVLLPKTRRERGRGENLLMELRTQKEFDVGGDRYIDLLLHVMVNVHVKPQLRYN